MVSAITESICFKNAWLILEKNLFFKPTLNHRHPDMMQFAELTWLLLPWETPSKISLPFFGPAPWSVFLPPLKYYTSWSMNQGRSELPQQQQESPVTVHTLCYIRVDGHNRLCLNHKFMDYQCMTHQTVIRQKHSQRNKLSLCLSSKHSK